MSRVLLSLSAVLAWASFVGAHPIPKDNHDRTVIVYLTPTALVVDYRLELDELTAFKDLPRSETASLTDRRDLPPVFLRYFAPVLANNLDATLDGKPLTLTCVAQQDKLLDHVRCDYRFEAKWTLDPDKEHAFTFEEGNYHNDSASKLLLSVNAAGVRLRTVRAPKPAVQEGDQLRRASATFAVEPNLTRALVKTGLPPDIDAERLGPEKGEIVAVLKPRPADAPERPPSVPSSPSDLATTKPKEESPPSTTVPVFKEKAEPETDSSPTRPRKLLDLLLDTRLGLGLALLCAVGFGAAHALTPGHGKTLVAAYLVGERGTVWHAALLGLVTTLTHTGAVLLVAAVLFFFFDNRIPPALMPILGLAGGLMVTGLGVWLLLQRLAGRADHVHIGGGHHHHHDHGHSHGGFFHTHEHGGEEHVHALPPGTGLRPLIWLGISGGIVPCGDAIAILMAAIAKGLVRQALPVLLAFSAGLAGVLVGIGIGVVYARRFGEVSWKGSARWEKVVRVLPLVSAVLVTALGVILCYDSFHGGP